MTTTKLIIIQDNLNGAVIKLKALKEFTQFMKALKEFTQFMQ